MEQVSEFVVAKRVIANVLNDAAAVSVGMSFLDLLLSSRWEALEERGANGGVPGDVDEFFVRKHAVPEEIRGRQQSYTGSLLGWFFEIGLRRRAATPGSRGSIESRRSLQKRPGPALHVVIFDDVAKQAHAIALCFCGHL